MRYTAVQIASSETAGRLCSELVYGLAEEFVVGARGPVAVFRPEKIVAYLVKSDPPRLFVFRTLSTSERTEADVPGVRPGVRLLLAVDTAGRIDRVRRLFAFFAKEERDPSDLGDLFYLRVSLLLGGRLPAHKVLRSLLDSEKGALK